jgi:mRNA-degrading endonuclease toxin of MazEF toxin-antitoxin module
LSERGHVTVRGLDPDVVSDQNRIRRRTMLFLEI